MRSTDQEPNYEFLWLRNVFYGLLWAGMLGFIIAYGLEWI